MTGFGRGGWALPLAALLTTVPAQALAQADSAAPAAMPAIRLVFTGDINLGSFTLPGGVPADSGRGFLQHVDSLLAGDFVVGNFEGALADSGASLKCGPPADTARPGGPRRRAGCYAFGTPTYLAPALAEAGFTHLNLANNHANDFGVPGRVHTERVFDSLGVLTYGPLGQWRIGVLERGSDTWRVGLLGFATYPHSPNLLDLPESHALVAALREYVDVLVVTFHGGTEGSAAVRTGNGPEFLGKEPRGDLRRWARVVLDAGADAVVGHGPHVLRGVEFYRGKPIFYSLGNFATYKGFNMKGVLGLTALLQLAIGPDGSFVGARMVPLVQRPGTGPEPDSTRAAVALLRRVTRLDFGPSGARIEADGQIRPPASPR